MGGSGQRGWASVKEPGILRHRTDGSIGRVAVARRVEPIGRLADSPMPGRKGGSQRPAKLNRSKLSVSSDRLENGWPGAPSDEGARHEGMWL